jgi:uncharacterized membrane-anchored protein YhcB (DUF1043 family)
MASRLAKGAFVAKEFWTLIITMVIGGLTYSIVSFSYMHDTFTTRTEVEKQEKRIDRFEDDINKKFDRIDDKLEKIIRDRGR